MLSYDLSGSYPDMATLQGLQGLIGWVKKAILREAFTKDMKKKCLKYIWRLSVN